MWKAVTVGAFALTVGMASSASAQQWGSTATAAPERAPTSAAPRNDSAGVPHRREQTSAPAHERAQSMAAADAIITEGQITRLRAALRLTPEQRSHWLPVEAALNDLARRQARGESGGIVQRLSDRTAALAETAMQLRRLKAIALPLIRSLDETQKREAIAFARNMGFQQMVAAF
jgi:hypothetical protein